MADYVPSGHRLMDGAVRYRARFHNEYQARLRSLPGIEQVGAASWLPGNRGHYQWGVRKVGVEGFTPTQIRVIDGRPMSAVLARHRARDWFMTLLVGAFSGVALVLAAVGV